MGDRTAAPGDGAWTMEQLLAAGAKKLGRQVGGFDDDTWNRHRFDIVVAASAAKFGSDATLRS